MLVLRANQQIITTEAYDFLAGLNDHDEDDEQQQDDDCDDDWYASSSLVIFRIS